MEAVVLVIHLIIALVIVVTILLQQSEGGGLGIGGGGMGNFASQRSTANFMTKLTTILGIAFVATSLTLAIMASGKSEKAKSSILDVTIEEAVDIKSSISSDGSKDGAINKSDKDKAGTVKDDVPTPPKGLSPEK